MDICFRAVLCLSCVAACSNNTAETNAKDPTYVEASAPTAAEPAMEPASLDDGRAPGETASGAVTPNAAPAAGAVAPTTAPAAAAPAAAAPAAVAPPAAAPPPAAQAKGAAPDNTRVNKRDGATSTPTAGDQKENQTDLTITQKSRQAVMADSSLSFTAKNVKIITQNGKVTLRGPVNTAQERTAIEAAARKVAGDTQVDNQLEVKK